jgi:hypothetical protein
MTQPARSLKIVSADGHIKFIIRCYGEPDEPDEFSETVELGDTVEVGETVELCDLVETIQSEKIGVLVHGFGVTQTPVGVVSPAELEAYFSPPAHVVTEGDSDSGVDIYHLADTCRALGLKPGHWKYFREIRVVVRNYPDVLIGFALTLAAYLLGDGAVEADLPEWKFAADGDLLQPRKSKLSPRGWELADGIDLIRHLAAAHSGGSEAPRTFMGLLEPFALTWLEAALGTDDAKEALEGWFVTNRAVLA